MRATTRLEHFEQEHNNEREPRLSESPTTATHHHTDGCALITNNSVTCEMTLRSHLGEVARAIFAVRNECVKDITANAGVSKKGWRINTRYKKRQKRDERKQHQHSVEHQHGRRRGVDLRYRTETAADDEVIEKQEYLPLRGLQAALEVSAALERHAVLQVPVDAVPPLSELNVANVEGDADGLNVLEEFLYVLRRVVQRAEVAGCQPVLHRVFHKPTARETCEHEEQITKTTRAAPFRGK